MFAWFQGPRARAPGRAHVCLGLCESLGTFTRASAARHDLVWCVPVRFKDVVKGSRVCGLSIRLVGISSTQVQDCRLVYTELVPSMDTLYAFPTLEAIIHVSKPIVDRHSITFAAPHAPAFSPAVLRLKKLGSDSLHDS